MTVVHGKNLDHKVVATAIESATRSVTVNMDTDIVETTAAGATAKAHVAGLYNWGMDADYVWNPVAAMQDPVVFGILTSGAQTVQVVPGGGTVSADNPIFKGSAILKSYSITVPYDGIVTARASYAGTGTLNRYTSGTF